MFRNTGARWCCAEKNDDPEAKLELDRIVDCPLGSNSKFQLYQDPVTKKYIMIGTEQAEDKPNRTVLSMAVSEDSLYVGRSLNAFSIIAMRIRRT